MKDGVAHKYVQRGRIFLIKKNPISFKYIINSNKSLQWLLTVVLWFTNTVSYDDTQQIRSIKTISEKTF